MIESVISLEPPGAWISSLLKEFDVEIKILNTLPYGKSGVQDLIELKLNGQDVETVKTYLEGIKDIELVELELLESDKAIGVVKCSECFGCRELLSAECFLVSARSMADGRLEYTIISSQNACLRKLMAKLEAAKASPKLVKMKKLSKEEMLTDNQEKIVKMAYQRGYYDFPKCIGVKDLAKIFSISPATLSEILRRGQKKIIESYFESR
ncbi:MAG: helix-turn-helix domain-containing protein [Thermoplasmata archaeon]|nr:helix-turn-helix domain-containing protein [Thermoplasmata archaeon]